MLRLGGDGKPPSPPPLSLAVVLPIIATTHGGPSIADGSGHYGLRVFTKRIRYGWAGGKFSKRVRIDVGI